MRRRARLRDILALCLLAAGVAGCRDEGGPGSPPPPPATHPAGLSFLHARGTQIVDAAGREVILRGCNLGSWLVIEPWMLDWPQVNDQWEVESTLVRRFGAAQAKEVLDRYRAGFITPRDFSLIRSFGFNVVRLPIHWAMIQEAQPPHAVRPDAWQWLDRALDMAQAAGVWVIIDLHGAPGGQSTQFHTGQAGQNHLWSAPEDRRQMVELWRALAAHCRDRAVVAGYDLLNEPYGDERDDLRPAILDLCGRCYRAVREVDAKHLIFFPGDRFAGIDFYGSPAHHGWTNAGFTEHFYPGLFGDPGTLETAGKFLNCTLAVRREFLRCVQSPYLVGEFNVVWESAGGDRLMRQYFDRFAADGWAATMWSYKLLKSQAGVGPNNWYLVTNATPLPVLDLKTTALADIKRYMDNLATMPLAVDEPLRHMLTEPTFAPLALDTPSPLPVRAPPHDPPPGWLAADIGEATAGGQTFGPDGPWRIYGGGSDIFGRADGFHFLYQRTSGEFTLEARVQNVQNSHAYAKAGLMARGDRESDAADVLINVFPGSEVAMCWRDQRSGDTREIKAYPNVKVAFLRLERRGPKITGDYSADGRAWHRLGQVAMPLLPEDCLAGLAVCAHSREWLTWAEFQDVRLSGGMEHPH